jgi:hypothetical protein
MGLHYYEHSESPEIPSLEIGETGPAYPSLPQGKKAAATTALPTLTGEPMSLLHWAAESQLQRVTVT